MHPEESTGSQRVVLIRDQLSGLQRFWCELLCSLRPVAEKLRRNGGQRRGSVYFFGTPSPHEAGEESMDLPGRSVKAVTGPIRVRQPAGTRRDR